MLLVFAGVLTASMVALGWGTIIYFLPGTRGENVPSDIALVGFFGLFLLGFIGTILNFVSPISSPIAISAGLVGACLFIWNAKRMFGTGTNNIVLTVVALLFFAFLFSAFAFIREPHADTDLYHLPAIHWLHNGPVPVGVANVVGQLGFNTIWFVIAAWFWWPGSALTPVFAINATMFTLLCVGFSQVALFRANGSTRNSARLYAATCLAFLMTGGISFIKIIGSPNTDIPAAILTIYIFFWALRLDKEEPTSERYVAILALLMTLCFFATAIKLSQMFILLIPFYLIARGVYRGFFQIRTVVALIWLPVIFGFFWLLRGVMLSGCLAYPASESCIDFLPWTATNVRANLDRWAIRAYGIYGQFGPPIPLSDWSWFPTWWTRFTNHHFVRGIVLFNAVVASLLCLSLSFWLLFLKWKKKLSVQAAFEAVLQDRFSIRSGTVVELMLFAVGCTVYWFLMAPDIRFGYGILTAVAILTSLIMISRGGECVRRFLFLTMNAIFVSVTVGIVIAGVLRAKPSDWLGHWPQVTVGELPNATCPSLFGFLPTYKCAELAIK